MAELSKEAHELVIKSDEKAVTKIEKEIDELVTELYGLSHEELQSLKEQL